MVIKSAEYLISSAKVGQCPDHESTEYAFIGRSNVGKSSLINMLTGYNKLAKTSSMPGKTMLINHFLINKAWYLVDLPGYGYAQRGKKAKDKLTQIIESYILGREQMTNLFLLIDIRHEPLAIDLEFIEWLGENGVPFSIVFTKADKLSKLRLNENVEAYKNTLLESWEELPPIFITSSDKKIGGEQLTAYIEQINEQLD